MMMASRNCKRKAPCYSLDRDCRQSKVVVSPEHVATQLYAMHLDSPEQRCPREVPIVFTSTLCSTPAGQCAVGAPSCHSQPVATGACSSYQADRTTSCSGGRSRRCKKLADEEDMPTECASYKITTDDCTDDSDIDDARSNCPVLELTSELIQGLDAAERIHNRLRDTLVQSVARPPCRQLVVWQPREDFVLKVLDDAYTKTKGPTITEVHDGMDVSRIPVVRGGIVVIDPDDDLWESDCDMMEEG